MKQQTMSRVDREVKCRSCLGIVKLCNKNRVDKV